MSENSSFEIVDGKVVLKNSEGYWWAHDYGSALDEMFPGQEAVDFAYCIEHNEMGPVSETNSVVTLFCEQVGENDGDDWIWLVTMEDGSRWRMTGGCDYTGWDCRSSNHWEPLP